MRAVRGKRGLAPALLVVVIAWALASVLMLTGTLLAAQQIESDLKGSIVGSTSGIDKDLDSVRLAAETTRISTDILTAAEPLVGQLDQVTVSARSIDREARSILDTAESINDDAVQINATAGSINSTVKSINTTARSINVNVASILGTARGIESTADAINANARSINGRVRNINGSVGSINGRLGGTLNEARTIDLGVAGINRRASAAISGVSAIKGDFEDIIDVVGQPIHSPDGDGGRSVHGHANAIDCRTEPLRDLLPGPPGPSSCNRD